MANGPTGTGATPATPAAAATASTGAPTIPDATVGPTDAGLTPLSKAAPASDTSTEADEFASHVVRGATPPEAVGTVLVQNQNADILAQQRGEEPMIDREVREAHARIAAAQKGTASQTVSTPTAGAEGTGEVMDPSQTAGSKPTSTGKGTNT